MPIEFVRKVISVIEDGETDDIKDAIEMVGSANPTEHYNAVRYYGNDIALEYIIKKQCFRATSLELEQIVQDTINLIDSDKNGGLNGEDILDILDTEVRGRI